MGELKRAKLIIREMSELSYHQLLAQTKISHFHSRAGLSEDLCKHNKRERPRYRGAPRKEQRAKSTSE